MYEVIEYLTSDGKNLYRFWLNSLSQDIKARIESRVLRFSNGNFGDSKFLGDGIFEARVMFGSGYRIYYGMINQKIILLLLGGNKKTQKTDIVKAKVIWSNVTKYKWYQL